MSHHPPRRIGSTMIGPGESRGKSRLGTRGTSGALQLGSPSTGTGNGWGGQRQTSAGRRGGDMWRDSGGCCGGDASRMF